MTYREETLEEQMTADVERSGIPANLIEKIGFKTLNYKATAKYLGKKAKTAACYKIPFFDHLGERIPFARLRLLRGEWYAGQKSKGKKYKYNQKSNTSPRLYFPNIYKWPALKKGKMKLDYLCITEGEKKAIKACLCGIPTVALSGVFNFKSSKRSITLLDEFRLFDLSEATVEICYDSDTYSNDNVLTAINQLASELLQLNPQHLHYVILKSDNRIGLDDFLASFPTNAEASDAFHQLERKEDARLNAMSAFDKTLCFIEKHERYYSRDLCKFYKSRQGLIDQYDNLPKIPDPVDMRKRISPIKLWFEQRSVLTTNVYDLTYIPGEPAEFTRDHRRYINTWRPTVIPRTEGEPTLWLELLKYLTMDLTPEQCHWVTQWLAYPLQHLGAKLYSSVFIYSHAQGIGKNFLIEPFISTIYGENYTRQDGTVIESDFNPWVARRQFVFMDEIHLTLRAERITAMNTLKSLITNETAQVNEKYQPTVSYPNYANFWMASQYSDALMISDKDRRHFVIHAPEAPMSNEFYKSLEAYSKGTKGIGQVYNYLMSYDTTSFEPKQPAPFTAAKQDVVEHSADNVTYLINLVKTEPSAIFSMDGKLPDKQLYSARELLSSLNNYASQAGMPRMGISPDAMGRYLTNAGIAHKHKLKVKISGSITSLSLYAVFYPRDWAQRTPADWLVHYKNHDERFAR